MTGRILSLLFAALAALSAAPPTVRLGLDTSGVEWQVSLEGGGEVCTRAGKPLLVLRDGERIRIWWDAKGEPEGATEYRVQVGPPLTLAAAEALMARLRQLGEQPARARVADGETWRVLTGRFATVEAAEPVMERLTVAGYEELWIASEPRHVPTRAGRALYGITERYARHPLPLDGVRFRPRGELTLVVGKGRYRGTVEIFPNAQGRLTVVNTLDLESYLRGVVPKEMGAWEFPAVEALKAQAVAARTYAVANLGKRAAEGFDLLDTPLDQVYGGRDGEQSLTDRAVAETAGLVATFEGRPIQALFMANSGGGTVDNAFVFGPGTPYLRPASNYVAQPQTLAFQGAMAPAGEQGWLSLDLLRLAAEDILPAAQLEGEGLGRPLRVSDLRAPLERLARRLGTPGPPEAFPAGPALFPWMARALALDRVVGGMTRVQDADYFQVPTVLSPEDRLLGAFLTRRGIVPSGWWEARDLTLRHGLLALARMWAELEPLDLLEGTLLRDGQVRRKGGGPEPFAVASPLLLAEESPGGALRLVAQSVIQVGDRLRWLAPASGPARLLVRRLDPDGASLDRYNPTAHWRVALKESELLERIALKVPVRSIQGLDLVHNAQGRVTEMVLRDAQGRAHRFTGMRIRQLLGLKDNVFRYVTLGSGPDRRWTFYGRGWGHGVGMDQTGAYGYALEGWTFEQILKHYYQGIALTKSY